MVKTGKVEVDSSASKVKSILQKLPIKILNFKNNITTNKIDYDKEEKSPHKHYAIIFSFRKINKPQLRN